MTTALNRTVQLLLTNKSGGSVAQGDVVVIDTTTASSFTTTTTSAYVAEAIGVVLEPNGIANNASGMVAINGYVPKINLSGSASLGDFVKTHTVAGQGVRHATPSVVGDFAQVLATGTSPAAFLFGFTNQGGGSGGAPTDADYWVETANGSLSAEVVVGTTGITTAAEASVQAAAKAGRLFFPNNGYWMKRDSGSAWVPWGPIFPLADPALQTFAWINQGGATVTTTNGGVALYAPNQGAADNIRIRKKSAPSTPYTVTIAFLHNALFWKNYPAVGLVFRQSSDGKLVTFQFGQTTVGPGIAVNKWTNATTFSAQYTASPTVSPVGGITWLRIADDGANRVCSLSVDGQNWLQIHTIGRTDFLTADEVGFFANANNQATPNYDLTMTLLSWKEA